MSSGLMVSDKARKLVEEESGRRIKAQWNRGVSLEQIATEAIIFYLNSPAQIRDHWKNDNSILEAQ